MGDLFLDYHELYEEAISSLNELNDIDTRIIKSIKEKYSFIDRLKWLNPRYWNSYLKKSVLRYQTEYLARNNKIDISYVPTGQVLKHTYNNGINEKIAVYTCITGGYDLPKKPLCDFQNCDYYLISDRKYQNIGKWKQISINEIGLPQEVIGRGNICINRYIKMHPWLIFPQYNYSIYLDGKVQPIADISRPFCELGDSCIGGFLHRDRDDVYSEAAACCESMLISKEELIKTFNFLKTHAIPQHTGMIECSVLYRKHNDELCKKINNDWWELYLELGIERDQLTFTPALLANGVSPSNIILSGKDIWNQSSFRCYYHNKDL